MCKPMMSFASLSLLSVLVSTAGAQLDPIFPGLQIPVAPPDSAESFDHRLVAADVDLDGRADLLSVVFAGSGSAMVQVLGVARALPEGGFAEPETWTIMPIQPSHVGALAVGDLDGNGWPDVAVTGSHKVWVLRGFGGGKFGPSASYFVSGEWLWDIALDDVNRDGRLDLVTASYGYPTVGGSINVNLADGTGGYLATQAWPLASPPEAIACGDLDGDGWMDVAAVGPDAAVLQILPSDGAGGFLAAESLPADVAPQRVLLGSLDADADLDVVVVAAGEGSGETRSFVRAWLNDGAGQLAAGTPVQVGRSLSDGLLHDLDADGDLDVVVVDAGQYNNAMILVDNDGAGALTLRDALPIDAPIEHATMCDGTGDGVPDLLLTPVDTSAVLFPARADGALAVGSACGLVEIPEGCLPADLDGDGWLDVVYRSDTPTVFASLMGSPGGLIPTPIPYSGFGTPEIHDFTLGDFTSDGRIDALVVTYTIYDETLRVAPGLGDGTFGPALVIHFDTNASPRELFPADFDADGWLDAALLSYGYPCRVYVFLNEGPAAPGQFADPKYNDCGDAAWDFAAADLNGDALMDVAVVRKPASSGLTSTLAVLVGDGTGELASPQSTDLPPSTSDAEVLRLADVDLDGRLDAVVALTNGDIMLAPGDGAGGWLPAAVMPSMQGNYGGALAVGDADGDGWPDVITAEDGAVDEVLVYRGDGAGGLLAPDHYTATGRVRDAVLADMTGDGRPDLLSAGLSTDLPLDGSVRVTENVRKTFTWSDLGHAKAGPHGQPQLTGTGTLEPGSSGALHLGQAAPSTLAALIVSPSEQPQAWKGGVLVPAAPQMLVYAPTDTEGRVVMTWTLWPAGASGAKLAFQFAIADPGAPQGLALSNALRATLPD